MCFAINFLIGWESVEREIKKKKYFRDEYFVVYEVQVSDDFYDGFLKSY